MLLNCKRIILCCINGNVYGEFLEQQEGIILDQTGFALCGHGARKGAEGRGPPG